MLRIRLSMGGVRKRPIYKIVIADSRYPRDGKFIEKIGYYNPLLPKDKKERIKFSYKEMMKNWWKVSHKIQKERDNPKVAEEELRSVLNPKKRKLSQDIKFRQSSDSYSSRPKIAILKPSRIISPTF